MTSLRAATLPLGRGCAAYPICAIHHQLYQDLFDWAGRLREVNLYLGDTPFCHFARIEEGTP
jgi:cell filamentation protein